MNVSKMKLFERRALIIAMLAVPVLFIFGFAAHPNLQSLSVMTNASDWVKEIRHNEHLQIAHLFVFLAAILLIYIAMGLKSLLQDKAPLLAFLGLFLVITGAIILAADKGSLCLVPSAFDTLNDSQYAQLLPGLQAMIDKRGLLSLLNLLFLLPAGFIVLSVGLIMTKRFPIWQPIIMIISMLLFCNPDIDLISLIASVILLIGMGGMAIVMLKQKNDN